MNLYRNGILLVGLWFSPLVMATPVGPYAGIAIGDSEIDGSSRKEDAFKLFVGYQADGKIGVEVASVDFGEFGPNNSDGREGLSFSVTGSAPLTGGFGFFGRAGFINWESDRNNTDGTDLLLGVGAYLDATQHVALRLEWEWYNDVADDDITLLTFGFSYTF